MKFYLLLILIKEVTDFVYGFSPAKEWSNRTNSMVWIDGLNRVDDPPIVDTFFDRVVSIAYESNDTTERLYKHETTGVFISKTQVLTTFNPYRTLIEESDSLNQMRIKIVAVRNYNNDSIFFEYGTNNSVHEIVCGRKVIPEDENNTRPIDMRHGIHFPRHDLMVLRLKDEILEFHNRSRYNRLDYKIDDCEDETNWTVCGSYGWAPTLTDLATLGEQLPENNVTLASIAHINNKHISENRYLEKSTFTQKENVIANCDEWIPRHWGHFICLNNVHNYEGIASGAVLFGGDKLFGLGAFAIWKGNHRGDLKKEKNNLGILVFTDVRPYVNRLLFQTCTTYDQELRKA